jgi:type II secretory pathway pseudopilin PulG
MARLKYNNGFTLIEVVLIIVVIGIMGTTAFKALGPLVENARETATLEEMTYLENAIIGDKGLVEGGIRLDYGYVGDIGSLPPNLDALMINPGGYSTWKGPYINNDYVENTDDYKTDAWGNFYSYTGGVTINSNGGGSPLSRQFARNNTDLISNTVRGYVIDKQGNQPGDSASKVNVEITYPDGTGGLTSLTTNPTAAGKFTFANVIPIGNHLLKGTYSTSIDTTAMYTSVTPVTGGYCELRFNIDFTSGGGSGGSVEYVTGTALAYGPGSNKNNLEFQIHNTSSTQNIVLASLTATYTTSPLSYYGSITWDGGTIWSNSTYNGSGDLAGFANQTMNPGQTATIQLKEFRRDQSGGGPRIDVNGINFVIVFSNGDTINFLVP